MYVTKAGTERQALSCRRSCNDSDPCMIDGELITASQSMAYRKLTPTIKHSFQNYHLHNTTAVCDTRLTLLPLPVNQYT